MKTSRDIFPIVALLLSLACAERLRAAAVSGDADFPGNWGIHCIGNKVVNKEDVPNILPTHPKHFRAYQFQKVTWGGQLKKAPAGTEPMWCLKGDAPFPEENGIKVVDGKVVPVVNSAPGIAGKLHVARLSTTDARGDITIFFGLGLWANLLKALKPADETGFEISKDHFAGLAAVGNTKFSVKVNALNKIFNYAKCQMRVVRAGNPNTEEKFVVGGVLMNVNNLAKGTFDLQQSVAQTVAQCCAMVSRPFPVTFNVPRNRSEGEQQPVWNPDPKVTGNTIAEINGKLWLKDPAEAPAKGVAKDPGIVPGEHFKDADGKMVFRSHATRYCDTIY